MPPVTRLLSLGSINLPRVRSGPGRCENAVVTKSNSDWSLTMLLSKLLSKRSLLTGGAATVGLAVANTTSAHAAAPIDDLASNEGIFVDKGTFKVMRGMAKTDPTAQIMKLGARPVDQGAIIFRSGDQLYIVDAVPAGAHMLNSFRDAFAPPG
jgi:hypothetical protein